MATSPEARDDPCQHDPALRWAEANRGLITQRLFEARNAVGERWLDVWHYLVPPVDWHSERPWLHRKGAAPADRGPVVIPGSRGSLS